jgi:hypothetical protein
MRLVAVHLMAPIKAPWDGQYTEMLQSRPGYRFELCHGWLHIYRDDVLVQVVSGALVRSGMVDVPPRPQTVELHVTNPEHLKVIEEHAPVPPQKRRGRPMKMQ